MFHISITYLQYIFRELLYHYKKIIETAKHFKCKDNIFFSKYCMTYLYRTF